MDNALWVVTILAHFTIFVTIAWKRWDRILPWFTATIGFGLAQVPIMYYSYTDFSPSSYARVYYAVAILEIGLYALSIMETWGKPRIDGIAASMLVYSMMKAQAMVLRCLHHNSQANTLMGFMRYPNLGCLLFWMFILMRYHALEVQFTQECVAMSTDEKELPEGFVAEDEVAESADDSGDDGDGGAPPPPGGA